MSEIAVTSLGDRAVKLCVESALYSRVNYQFSNRERDLSDELRLGSFHFDCHCIQCARSSTFRVSRDEAYRVALQAAHKSGVAPAATIHVSAICQRDNSHEYIYVFAYTDSVIVKIGQFPSIEDISSADLERFRPVLEKRYFSELHKAGGLASHGLGIASFVYLRRIFERLITTHHEEFVSREGSEIPDFKGMRMEDKIASLRSVLPGTLVENRATYGILSLGLHELSEEDCLRFFPVVRAAIVAILEDDLQNKQKRLAAEQLRQAISEAAGAVKSTKAHPS